MDKIFLTVLNMSITGAFVIAAVMLARLPLKKAPKIISYCLWAVVGFRLICPFSIEGVLSLLPIKPQPIPIQLSTMEHADVISGIDSGSVVFDGTIETMLTYARTSVSSNPYSAMTRAISYLWLIGAVAMLLYGIASYILLKRRMRTAIRIEGNIYETDNTPSPFVLGIIKPKIYLPLTLADDERKYILLHERTHIRRGDHIVKFAAYFILCLHWFNPLAWAAFLLMGVDMEMSCDERVLKELGGDTKHDYSRSLLSLATGRRVIGGSPLAFGEGGVKGRIKNVLNFRKPSKVIIVAAVALVAVLSVGFAVNQLSGKQPFKDLNSDEIESIVLYCNPPDVSVNIEDKSTISEIAVILRTVVTYEKDFLGEMLAGQLVRYTLAMQSGETIEVEALGSFIVIDGQRYKTKYEPSEELNRLGNQLRGDTKSPYQQAYDVVSEHYPEAFEIISYGSDTISYTDPPAPVEVFKFEVVTNTGRITCAVSKESGIFFTYSDNTWWAFTGLAEGSGATQNMTIDDVRAIAQKIGTDLTMGDFRDVVGTDVGSGIYVMRYDIVDSDYIFLVGSGDMNTVMYAYLQLPGVDIEEAIDIRYYDVDKFIANGTRELVSPMPEPQETTPPSDPGYFTDPVEVVKAELEADGCVILNVFAVDWATRQYALDGKDYDFVSIYVEYLEGPYGDAIYTMNYTLRRPSNDSTAQWTHDEPVFWEGIHYGVAKYAAEQYYAETGRKAKIADMRPTSIDYSAYVPQDKQNWQAVAFNVEYEDDPKSHLQRIAVLVSQDGVSRWQIVYWSGITTEE